MVFALTALWTICALLLISDPRSAGARRLAAVCFFGGTGALAAVLDGQIIPAFAAANPDDRATGQVLYAVQAVSSVSSYYGVPYFFLLFALAYRPIRMPPRLRRTHAWLLLLPVAASLLLTPAYTEFMPVTFTFVVWWAVPYLLAGIVLVLTKRPVYRGYDRTHWIVCLAVLPPALFFMILNYVFPSMGYLRMWVYNTLWVGIGFGIFLIGLFTYGFLGVRLAFERRRMDSTLRAVTSGTAILNHAIKNDTGKMKLFGEKIKAYAASTNQPELLEDIGVVLSASRHIQEMISRVQRKTEDLAIKPEPADLGALIRDTLRSFGSRLDGIQVRETLPDGWYCRIDTAQVGEAVHNIVSNALEAMDGQGELTVRLSETKREWRIEIADSGRGMSKEEVSKALEPFHTTKGGTGVNFGLGLPYAYHVMRKHGGMLLLRSHPGAGSTVCLTFPKRAVHAGRTADQAITGGRNADV